MPRAGRIGLRIRGPILRADLPGLSDRVCALLARHPGCLVCCDVPGMAPDAVTVEAVARLQLVARRYGCRVLLCRATGELRDLVAFVGLTDVLPVRPVLPW